MKKLPIAILTAIALPFLPGISSSADKPNLYQINLERMGKLKKAMLQLKQSNKTRIKGSISPNIGSYYNDIKARINAANQVVQFLSKAHPSDFNNYDPTDISLIKYLYAGALKRNKFNHQIMVDDSSRVFLISHNQYLIANTALPARYKQAAATIKKASRKYLKMREIAQSTSRTISLLENLSNEMQNEFTAPQKITANTKLFFDYVESIQASLRHINEVLDSSDSYYMSAERNEKKDKADDPKFDKVDYDQLPKAYDQYWHDFLSLINKDARIKKLSDGSYQVKVYYVLPNPTFIGTTIQKLAGATPVDSIGATTRFPIPVTKIPESKEERERRLRVIHLVETRQPVLVIKAPGQKARYVTIFGMGEDEGAFCNKPKPSWKATELLRHYWSNPNNTPLPKVCFGPKSGVTDALGRIEVTYTTRKNPVENKLFPKLEITYSDRDRK